MKLNRKSGLGDCDDMDVTADFGNPFKREHATNALASANENILLGQHLGPRAKHIVPLQNSLSNPSLSSAMATQQHENQKSNLNYAAMAKWK